MRAVGCDVANCVPGLGAMDIFLGLLMLEFLSHGPIPFDGHVRMERPYLYGDVLASICKSPALSSVCFLPQESLAYH
jgi:hypothetical protein